MARLSQPVSMHISRGFSLPNIGLLLPLMCAGLVLGIEAWQNGVAFSLVLGAGAILLIGFLLFGLRLYTAVGNLPIPLRAGNALVDLIRSDGNETEIGVSPITWRSVTGTAVLRL